MYHTQRREQVLLLDQEIQQVGTESRVKFEEPQLFGPNGKLVIKSPLKWAYFAVQSIGESLELLPKHFPIVFEHISTEEIHNDISPFGLFTKNVSLTFKTFPYISTEREDNEAFWKLGTLQSVGKEEQYRQFSHAERADREHAAYLEGVISHAAGCLEDRIKRTALVRVPLSHDLQLGTTKSNYKTPKTYFWRFAAYLVLFSRQLVYPELRDFVYDKLLQRDDETCPEACVLDIIFRTNKEKTNMGKIQKMVRWFDCIRSHLSLEVPPHLIGFFIKAYKCTVICLLVQKNHFKQYLFRLLCQKLKNSVDTTKNYFRIIGEINLAQIALDLNTIELTIPSIKNASYLRKKRQHENKTKKPKGSAAVPINSFLHFIGTLYHSASPRKEAVALFAILNTLTCSRFSEVMSIYPGNLRIETKQISPTKVIKILPIHLLNTKTEEQKYDIPVQETIPLLNLDTILERIKRIHLKPEALNCFDTTHLGKLTSTTFSNLLKKEWNEYAQTQEIFYDLGNTKLGTHSMRKISTHLYLYVFGFKPDEIRILFGHTKNSTTLESSYITKTRNQLQQEMYWNV